MINRKCLIGFAVLLLTATATTSAFAGWTVTSLAPAGSTESYVAGICGGQQVGYATIANSRHAGIWSGTAASFVDLNPAGHTSELSASSGGQQVGRVPDGGSSFFGHAGLWSGTAASFVDLNPSGIAGSAALGVSGGQQVGWTALPGSKTHASLWTGTAESFVDLHPDGSLESSAFGVSDGQQVGSVTFSIDYNMTPHAALWNGTAASFVDLGLGRMRSVACAVSGGLQVGIADDRAALWAGSAESRISLAPAGSSTSAAYAVSGEYQAGYAFLYDDARKHAGIWRGTAESWFDLHGFLPENGYFWSEAKAIEVIGNDIWVAGYARSKATYEDEAVLWHYTDVVPEPSSLLALGSGMIALGGLIRRRR